MRPGSPKPVVSAIRSSGVWLSRRWRAPVQAAGAPPPWRGRVGLRGEHAGEVVRAHRRFLGEPLDGELFAEMLVHPVDQRGKTPGMSFELHKGDFLRADKLPQSECEILVPLRNSWEAPKDRAVRGSYSPPGSHHGSRLAQTRGL
jgi:hypothetical protein